jgi:hypothetical protein
MIDPTFPFPSYPRALPTKRDAPVLTLADSSDFLSVGPVVPFHEYLPQKTRQFAVTWPNQTTIRHPKVSMPLNLGEKLLGDFLVAIGVTACVSPFLTIIDKAMVQRSANSHTLLQSATESASAMSRHPFAFVKSPTFLWMWMTYASTYTAVNMIRTLTEHQDYQFVRDHYRNNSDAISSAAPAKPNTNTVVFLGTTAVNTSASLIRDRAYAKMFGNAAATSVPRVSYGLWMARDFTVIGSSFVLPEYVANFLQHRSNLNEADALNVAQLATPLAAQAIAAPLHFVGLDCYNRALSHLPVVPRLVERGRFLAKGFVEVTAAKMIRILPGYGIAGVYNRQFRNQWRDNLIRRQIIKNTANRQTSSISQDGVRNLVALIRSKSST